MNRGTAWFVHGGAIAVGGTGLVYGFMRYCVVPDDEFAVVNHPLQPAFEAWHILLAPLLLFGVGVLWRSHVWGRIRSGTRERRRTGMLLALLFAPMTASGPALQTAVDEGWRLFWIWTHATSSTAWVLVYLVHQCLPATVGRAVGYGRTRPDAAGSAPNRGSSREFPASAGPSGS